MTLSFKAMALVAGLAMLPASAALAQTGGSSTADHSRLGGPNVAPAAPSGGVTTGHSSTAPGATGRGVVPGSNSTVAADHNGTAMGKSGAAPGQGGEAAGGSGGSATGK